MDFNVLSDLPIEAFMEIMMRTDGKAVGKCRRVCKTWQEYVDSSDYLWHKLCIRDFKFSSKIAKKKAGNECDWYHIYRNLTMWSKITSYERNMLSLNTSIIHKNHALEIDDNYLPLRLCEGITMHNLNTFTYEPIIVPVPDKTCRKLVNSSTATILLLKTGILVEKTVKFQSHMCQAFFEADDFILTGETLYFFRNRDVYECDLSLYILSPQLVIHCEYDIKTIQYDSAVLYIFTKCGKIINVYKDKSLKINPIECPSEWIRQLKYVCALNDKNYIYFSRNLFKIKTDKHQHLYLDFPPITALFFYGENVLIGTECGKILLYTLHIQKQATKPIFEEIAYLKDGQYAMQLDVCERKSGPVIVVLTCTETVLIEIDFFPNEKPNRFNFTREKYDMYHRLLRIHERLEI